MGDAFRVGLGGPVGAGKTSLTASLCKVFSESLSMAVITNDIYTCLLYTSDAADE